MTRAMISQTFARRTRQTSAADMLTAAAAPPPAWGPASRPPGACGAIAAGRGSRIPVVWGNVVMGVSLLDHRKTHTPEPQGPGLSRLLSVPEISAIPNRQF